LCLARLRAEAILACRLLPAFPLVRLLRFKPARILATVTPNQPEQLWQNWLHLYHSEAGKDALPRVFCFVTFAGHAIRAQHPRYSRTAHRGLCAALPRSVPVTIENRSERGFINHYPDLSLCALLSARAVHGSNVLELSSKKKPNRPRGGGLPRYSSPTPPLRSSANGSTGSAEGTNKNPATCAAGF
jgi:hypothetical protein